jgi:hypothetical protein
MATALAGTRGGSSATSSWRQTATVADSSTTWWTIGRSAMNLGGGAAEHAPSMAATAINHEEAACGM